MKIKKFDFADTDLIDKNIRVEKKPPDRFEEDTLSIIELDIQQGIMAVAGRLKGDNIPNMAIQSYLFDKQTWTVETAGKWVREAELAGQVVKKDGDGLEVISKIDDLLQILFEKLIGSNGIDEVESESVFTHLKSISEVEIFSTGKHNGDEYSIEDLNEIAKSFTPLKKTLQPYVKLGHNEEQLLLAKDGLPAAGWIENVYVRGNKLFADIVDVPSTIYELIKNKSYKRISSEIYWNLKDQGGKIYKRALKAIALLGGDTPAVGSLADVQALYTKKFHQNKNEEIKGDLHFASLSINDSEKEETALDEKKYADQLAKIVELEKKYSDLEKVDSDKTTELKQYKENSLKMEQEKRDSEIKSKVDKFISEGKIIPAQKELATQLYSAQDSLRVYSKEDQKEDVVSKFFEAAIKVVDEKEYTQDSEKKSSDQKEDELSKKIKDSKSYEEAKLAAYAGVEEAKHV